MNCGPSERGAAEDDGWCGAGVLRSVARAKVNLTLYVRGRRPDGYHELESLVAFTQFGDILTLNPGQPFSLEVDGPFAEAIEGGNLIEKAARLYREHSALVASRGRAAAESPAMAAAGAFRLDKQIPVAAGLGGGSADAAAALRLLAGVNNPSEAEIASLDIGLPIPSSRLMSLLPLAREIGADVPVCLFSRPAIMTGIGERLRFLPASPSLPVVLVNPRVPLSTAAVFRELRADVLGARASPDEADPPSLRSPDDVIAYAGTRRNDLEAPARRLAPVIGVILDRLAACPGAVLARLSGSGPTCFALFREKTEAEDAAACLSAEQPAWWIKATMLG